MEVQIENLPQKKLVGKRMRMSRSDDRTVALFRSFKPHLGLIEGKLNATIWCLQVYEGALNFNIDAYFDKWAAVEVNDAAMFPPEMEKFTIPEGLYAVILLQGIHTEALKTLVDFYQNWLSQSPYILDNRPHFQIMGEKYHPLSPDSEEEAWIPIRLKF